jgi:5-formyltetrahydrofolate cyclo-ligase
MHVLRMDKAKLRRHYNARRDKAKPQTLLLGDVASVIETSVHIATYIPINNEVDTMAVNAWILAQHPSKKLYIPACPSPIRNGTNYQLYQIQNLFTDIQYNTKGIPQIHSTGAPTIAPNQIDFWMIPGVAFTESGIRLGYGKGIYDRLLASAKGLRYGISHQCQKSDDLPQSEWDVSMDNVLFY